jgi:hypothetical protein
VVGAIAGDSNTAVTFNGTTQHVTAAGSSIFSATNAWSLELWVNRTGSSGILFLARNAGSTALQIGSGNVQILRSFSPEGAKTAVGALGLGWHYVVGTYDGSNLRLYVDGVLAGGPTASTSSAGAAGSIDIAANATSGFFAGTLDEIAIYGRALSASEIATHYNVGKGL